MNELMTATYLNEAGERDYKVYAAAPRPGEAPPLFVMLHGCRQNAADFAAGTRMNALADECGGVVLYPEQCKMANFGGCWNWHQRKHQAADAGEPSLIAGMTRQVMAAYGVDPARVYVAGMSAGGAMAVILGQTYPDLYAAVGVHSGMPAGEAVDLLSAWTTMNSGPAARAPGSRRPRSKGAPAIATIIFHGDRDHVVHPANGVEIHARARRPARRTAQSAGQPRSVSDKIRVGEGASTHAFTRTAQSHSGVPQTELWMVHGAGHAWAGGSADGSYTDAEGPDASRAMVRFFLQQRLGGGMVGPQVRAA